MRDVDLDSSKVWDLSTRTLSSEIPGHTKPILSLAWSSLDSLIVSASADNTVRVSDMKTGTAVHVFELASVHHLFGTPAGALFVALCRQKTMICDARTGRQVELDSSPTKAAPFTPDGESLLSIGIREINIWDLLPMSESLDSQALKQSPQTSEPQLTRASIRTPQVSGTGSLRGLFTYIFMLACNRLFDGLIGWSISGFKFFHTRRPRTLGPPWSSTAAEDDR